MEWLVCSGGSTRHCDDSLLDTLRTESPMATRTRKDSGGSACRTLLLGTRCGDKRNARQRTLIERIFMVADVSRTEIASHHTVWYSVGLRGLWSVWHRGIHAHTHHGIRHGQRRQQHHNAHSLVGRTVGVYQHFCSHRFYHPQLDAPNASNEP